MANDAEFERGSISSVIDERALRELYLVPFELGGSRGWGAGVMTSYNRVNGRWLTEQPELLLDLLREEWGFEGLVMTDWFGVADTDRLAGRRSRPRDARARAVTGLDASSQPSRWRGRPRRTSTRPSRRLLGGFDRIGALGLPDADDRHPSARARGPRADPAGRGRGRPSCSRNDGDAPARPVPSLRPGGRASGRTPSPLASWAAARPG